MGCREGRQTWLDVTGDNPEARITVQIDVLRGHNLQEILESTRLLLHYPLVPWVQVQHEK